MIKIVKFLKKEKNILYSLLLSTLFFCIISFAYIVKIESVKSKNILFFPDTDVAYDNNSFLDYLSKHDYNNIFVQIKEANTEKTKYMCFYRARITHFNDLIIYTNNGSNIERVTEYKYLGIWIDEKLSFTFNIKNLVCRLLLKIGYFYRNKATFP